MTWLLETYFIRLHNLISVNIFFTERSVFIYNCNKKTLCVVTIAMIYSNLASKFQYFRRPIYNPVEHLWWSFYCKNSKPLSIFTKKFHHRWCLLGSKYASTIWRPFKRLIYLKNSTSLNSSNVLLNIELLTHLTY